MKSNVTEVREVDLLRVTPKEFERYQTTKQIKEAYFDKEKYNPDFNYIDTLPKASQTFLARASDKLGIKIGNANEIAFLVQKVVHQKPTRDIFEVTIRIVQAKKGILAQNRATRLNNLKKNQNQR